MSRTHPGASRDLGVSRRRGGVVVRVYSLTPLTRSANLQRRVVIQGFDLPLRGVTIAGFAALPAVLLTAIFWSLLGTYALFIFAMVEGLAFWLVETRSRSGLQLRQYQRFMDMRRTTSGQFILCGVPIEPERHQFGHVLGSSIPGRPLDLAPLFPSNPTDRRTRRMVGTESSRKEQTC